MDDFKKELERLGLVFDRDLISEFDEEDMRARLEAARTIQALQETINRANEIIVETSTENFAHFQNKYKINPRTCFSLVYDGENHKGYILSQGEYPDGKKVYHHADSTVDIVNPEKVN